jgi:hypothetical protein
LRSLTSKASEAVKQKQHRDDKVAVYIVAFDQIVPIMIQANRHEGFESVRWYGSDGSAQNEGLLKNLDAAEFAAKTNFLNAIYGINGNEIFKKLEARIVEEIGRVPRSYAEVTYDEFWVATTLISKRLSTIYAFDQFFQDVCYLIEDTRGDMLQQQPVCCSMVFDL